MHLIIYNLSKLLYIEYITVNGNVNVIIELDKYCSDCHLNKSFIF